MPQPEILLLAASTLTIVGIETSTAGLLLLMLVGQQVPARRNRSERRNTPSLVVRGRSTQGEQEAKRLWTPSGSPGA
jgi:hypothetical protein